MRRGRRGRVRRRARPAHRGVGTRAHAGRRGGRDRRSAAPRCTRAVARARHARSRRRRRPGRGARGEPPASPAGLAGACTACSWKVASVMLPTSTLPHVAQPSSSHVSFPTSHGEVGRCSRRNVATRTGSLAGHVALLILLVPPPNRAEWYAESDPPLATAPIAEPTASSARAPLATTACGPDAAITHTAMKTTSASPPRTRSAAACCSNTASSSRSSCIICSRLCMARAQRPGGVGWRLQ